MRDVFLVLLGLCLLGVATTLGLGFYALFRGGQFGRAWSNKLMQLRILLQFAAIMMLAAVFWLSRSRG